ncbi:GNAT family N-acetyltransferase [Pseudomonas protegens]|uniref:GNAT family N-acetyltransferase n=1 Tax=Pseudomonas protegens TaxID=380021 RepID=UPI00275A335D|nr:GNAT family N-acetyltransferase [Pseudomonas protegens]MDP9506880.1 GNAT family N-acetyltransferase [Pseudomonas protegens]
MLDVERLQAFFVENPDYFHIVHGCAPQPDEARDEIDDRLPEGWSFTRKWKIGYFDGTGALVAMVSIVSDLLAPGVWHMGLFMVASSLRGRGIARQLHRELEDWAAGMGARWLRLSVVFANVRAEGFWRACGYVEARTRDGIELGQLRHRVRIMIKPLSLDSLEDYLTLMPRDRVEPPVSV